MYIYVHEGRYCDNMAQAGEIGHHVRVTGNESAELQRVERSQRRSSGVVFQQDRNHANVSGMLNETPSQSL